MMKILSPVSMSPPGEAAEGRQSLTALVTRSVPASQADDFQSSLMELLREFNNFPGTSGAMVFRQEHGNETEFLVLQHFSDPAAHQAWIASPAFSKWRQAVAPETWTAGHVRRFSGVEALFARAGTPGAPPRWKMALILLLVVYPMSLAMSHWGAPLLATMPLLAGSLLTSVLMVGLMTYVLVPLLTKLFSRWLNTPASR